MTMDKEIQAVDIEALRRSNDRLSAALEKRVPEASKSTNTTTQTITIDAGSKALWFALWLATICCVVMFIMGIDQRSQMSDMAKRNQENADRLSILLQWAPNLRDEINREMEKRKSK